MSKKENIAVILVILATVGTLLAIMGAEKYRIKKKFTVELIARSPEHGNWYPQKITVAFGQEVKILLRNIETVSHGFALPEFNVAVREIKAGEVKVVEFRADKRGVFPFMCTIWCSDNHLQMRGELFIQ